MRPEKNLANDTLGFIAYAQIVILVTMHEILHPIKSLNALSRYILWGYLNTRAIYQIA